MRGWFDRRWLAGGLAVVLCTVAMLGVAAPAEALIAVPSFVMTPTSGPLGTTFSGDIEYYSGVPGQPNHGCSTVVSYTVTDPNGDIVAQGDIPPNLPGPPVQSFSFQVTVAAPSPVGVYTVSGVCDGFDAQGQFQVVAVTPPPAVLTLSPADQAHTIDDSATVTAHLADG